MTASRVYAGTDDRRHSHNLTASGETNASSIMLIRRSLNANQALPTSLVSEVAVEGEELCLARSKTGIALF